MLILWRAMAEQWSPAEQGLPRPSQTSVCVQVSTLKFVYLLQHNFQFRGRLLHMRCEYRQAVPEVVSETPE